MKKTGWKYMVRVCLLILFAAAILLPQKAQVQAETLTGVTNLRQTDSSTDKVKIEWDKDLNAATYGYQISYDSANWTEEKYTTALDAYVNNLNSGKTYYMRVRSYDQSYYLSSTPAEGAVSSDWSTPIEVVTQPESMQSDSIKEVGATTTSIDLEWEVVDGANIYEVKYDVGGSKFLAGTTADTKFTITGLEPDSDYKIYVFPERTSSSGYTTDGYCNGTYKYTMAAKVKNLKLREWNTQENEIYLEWGNDFSNITGYEVYITNLSGKKVKNFKTTNSVDSFSISSIKNKGFIFKVRTYRDIDGITLYGDWSSKKVVVAQPKVKLTKKSSKSITVSWNKVAGATSYSVYRSSAGSDTGFKKIKTTKSTKFTNTGLSSNKTYYYYVVANGVEVDGKSYKSTAATYREIAYMRMSYGKVYYTYPG